MKIRFYGAAQTVTGSQHLLEVNGRQILLECGLFQGKREESFAKNRTFPFRVDQLDAVILSHAHIDHSGNLPNLVKSGYEGKIYCTPATARLADVMLQDSGHIQELDAEYVNKKRWRQRLAPIEPIYTAEDAVHVKSHFVEKPYNQPFEVVPGVVVTLVDAGHILGSAAVVLDIEEKGRKFRLWFSGDIGRLNLPLLQDPIMPSSADYLIMECTYGDKPHRDPEDAYTEFRDVVRRTVERRGKVIIPAFAVGRTQELVYDLNRMMTDGEIPRIPVFVDSPLAVNATKVFQAFPELFDDETQEFIRTEKYPALMFPGLKYIQSVDESKALNERHESMVIISASGMAETGRILHHLKNNIEDSRNTVLIVSWQAPHTLGRRLAEREREVNIFGLRYLRRAEVATIGGLSAHAGQDFLLNYARAADGKLKKIFLVHGEEKAANALMTLLKPETRAEVHYPSFTDSMEI